MRTQYLIVGPILILLGIFQIWTRTHLPPAPPIVGDKSRPVQHGRAWHIYNRVLGYVAVLVGIGLVIFAFVG